MARAFVLQQFSSRLFRSDSAEQWVLTGGTALQYRSTEARPTADADLAFALEASEVETALRQALAP
ncbi:nucleotidyl transferase AbiEii/AbiGii toxin family protein, partial [Prevotella lacticifex]|uniref:nucleotidyl transferase AbiEii/AbiGii toxin family protein n=1 Tax=Prevotella lacticifex TaxID=2854755 RepID=UPI001CC36421